MELNEAYFLIDQFFTNYADEYEDLYEAWETIKAEFELDKNIDDYEIEYCIDENDVY